ncbi:hypothetical protein LG329_01270 [Virgibacillus necropolis]|uniref:hypothetical protein n=1 Tax=Virgibacillus necropolis TaxID=163877 RepID=UPI00384EE104
MYKDKKQRNYAKVQEKVKELPWYVGEYIDKKRRKLSSASLLNYCHDFNIFFDWLLAEGYSKGSRKEVPLDVLEKLTVQQLEDFLSFLEFKLENSPITINRKLSALKSLYCY